MSLWVGTRHRHKASGKVYTITGIGRLMCSTVRELDEREAITYADNWGYIYVRLSDEFAEKFEPVVEPSGFSTTAARVPPPDGGTDPA